VVLILCIVAYLRGRKKKRLVAHSIKQLMALFSAMDADGSGDVDTAEFTRAFNMPDDLYTSRLIKMLDVDANGFITFHEFVYGLARFSGCGTTHDFAFRLLDAEEKGSIPKADAIQLITAVLPQVQKERRDPNKYSTRKVMDFVRDLPDMMQPGDLESVEVAFPGLFGGVAEMWHQFEDVVGPCARLKQSKKDLGAVGVDAELAKQSDISTLSGEEKAERRKQLMSEMGGASDVC